MSNYFDSMKRVAKFASSDETRRHYYIAFTTTEQMRTINILLDQLRNALLERL